MITTTIITSMSVNPRVLRMRLPFLWRGCYELAAGAAKSGDRRRVSPTERCARLQYSVRKITGLAGLCVLAAALLAGHVRADNRFDDARQAQDRGSDLYRDGDFAGAL